MTTKSNKSLNNIKKVDSPPNNPNQFGVKIPRPNYRWLDLVDTERYGQKTYNDKTYFIPTVYRGDGGIDVGLELVNYFQFTASLAPRPTVINGTQTFDSLFQSFNIPSPFQGPSDTSSVNLTPMSYDGLSSVTLFSAGVYFLGFQYNISLEDFIESIFFEVSSNINGVLFSDKISASTKIAGSDLSDFIGKHTGNGEKNVYIQENEAISFKIIITSVAGESALGSIDDASIFLSYLRPNR